MDPVHVVWDTDSEAPLATYYADPPELWLNWYRWQTLSEAQQRGVLAHELGHHYTGTVYFWTDDPDARGNLWRLEAKARRKGLELQIPDADVIAAIRDGCSELREFAGYWRVDEAAAAERLAVYRGGRWGR